MQRMPQRALMSGVNRITPLLAAPRLETRMSLTPLPIPSALDLKLIEQCDSSVRIRRLIELAVVRKMVGDLINSGYTITVDDGEDRPVANSTDIDAIIEAAFAVDDCTIIVRNRSGKGWIRLVFGNGGWDVINDHTVNLEQVMGPTNDYAEELSAWC